jgi:hypothetical protein
MINYLVTNGFSILIRIELNLLVESLAICIRRSPDKQFRNHAYAG